MDAARFSAIVEAYGASPKRWPAEERAAAEAFAGRPEAQGILAEARALDAELDSARDDAPPALGVMRRALRAVPKPEGGRDWRPMAAMAACALIGLALGFGGAREAAQSAYADAALSVVFAADVGG
ncbi:MAG: hypothetical protein AB7P07_07105 [Hyphomonadaceae bacterium]